MLASKTVLKWQADSWKRVLDTTNGTTFLLNTNRFDSIRATSDGNSSLYYFDNIYDRRDAGHYMVIDNTQAELIIDMDTAASHASLTLNVYLNNDATQATTATEISLASFAYAIAQTNHTTRSWVTYVESGWDIKIVLVNNTLADLLSQVA